MLWLENIYYILNVHSSKNSFLGKYMNWCSENLFVSVSQVKSKYFLFVLDTAISATSFQLLSLTNKDEWIYLRHIYLLHTLWRRRENEQICLMFRAEKFIWESCRVSSMLMLAGTGVVNHAPPKASLTKPTSWLTGEQVYLKSFELSPRGSRWCTWQSMEGVAAYCSLFSI